MRSRREGFCTAGEGLRVAHIAQVPEEVCPNSKHHLVHISSLLHSSEMLHSLLKQLAVVELCLPLPARHPVAVVPTLKPLSLSAGGSPSIIADGSSEDAFLPLKLPIMRASPFPPLSIEGPVQKNQRKASCNERPVHSDADMHYSGKSCCTLTSTKSLCTPSESSKQLSSAIFLST